MERGSSSVGQRSSIISSVFLFWLKIVEEVGGWILFCFVVGRCYLVEWMHWLVSSHATNSWNSGLGCGLHLWQQSGGWFRTAIVAFILCLMLIRWDLAMMGSGFGDIGCSSNLLIARPYQLVQFGRQQLLSAEVTLRLDAFAGILPSQTAPIVPGTVGLNAALAANLLLSLYWIVKFGFCCSISSH
ncbi:hypothetical protein Nepgr_023055 [Nepenthes gracilis]|uniref:Uncharacterized protein n=1 Tax=Nepenthes gracilis TaxID=150966 RepID=A0AAD3T010_NEPGR|nr:hypothetical protein Nepgr_023055 [Nepenthes gracilis]